MPDHFAPTLAEARQRVAAVRPDAYARTRNALEGAVSGLSPYITHGLVSLADVLHGVLHGAQASLLPGTAPPRALAVQHKFVYELGWREYFRHVWQHRGDAILQSLHEGPLPDDLYATALPTDIRLACTGVPVVDEAVRTLYRTGWLHNHARMWLASYVVHVRKVHWRAGADWLYAHLLDGDLASNHLSWQWVAGTGSSKPYLFNADNVARYAPAAWHSPDTVVDASYEALDLLARRPPGRVRTNRPHTAPASAPAAEAPALHTAPPHSLGCTPPDAAAVAGRDVWLVHPWNLGALPATLHKETLVIGVFLAEFHQCWPWAAQRWHFVGSRMAELASHRWAGDAAHMGQALATARSVQSTDEPHLHPWLARWAQCQAVPALFPAVPRRCDSFSQWWTRSTRGLESAAELLASHRAAAC